MARARVAGFEHGLGSGTRARRTPAPPLAASVTRELLGYHHRGVGFGSWLEPPRPELSVMISLEGAITVDGAPLPTAWIGGLEERPTIVGVGGSFAAIDLKLDPLEAGRVLPVPPVELTGACVALADVFGRAPTDELLERVHAAADWDARFDAVERFLVARPGRDPDPAVRHAWRRLVASGGQARVAALAAELGSSRRYLTGRFHEQVGLAPKTVARQLRFAAVRRAIEAQPGRWADIAAEAGYADQSHLGREFRQLAGVTPTDYLARLIPHGGLVGDGL